MTDLVWKLTSASQLSMLIEASSPKPGNVNRVAQFSDISYRHFLASSAMLAHALHASALQGVALAEGEIDPHEVGLGGLIHRAVAEAATVIGSRNTVLGTILLYVPLLVGVGHHLTSAGEFSKTQLKSDLHRILAGTTVKDAVDLYRAFHICRPSGNMIRQEPSWSKTHDRYDIENPDAMKNITEDGVTLLDLFRISAPVDEIANEWATGFDLVLNHVYPFLDNVSTGIEDIEEGVVKTYVWLLARRPDGLIVKKAGLDRAEEVRSLASQVLAGWEEARGAEDLLNRLDDALRREGNLLNPGTTADLVSASVLCKLTSKML